MSILKSIATIREYRKDPMAFIKGLNEKNGHRSYVKIFHRELIVLSHPDDILHILKQNTANYTKGRSTKALKRIIGNGLITSEGNFWRNQHKLIRPVMNVKSIMDFCHSMDEVTAKFLKETPDGVHDSLELMNKLAWRIILKTLFGQESNEKLDSWLHDVLFLMDEIVRKTRAIVPFPNWLPTERNRKFKEVMTNFDEFIYGLIKERKEGKPRRDLLQLLIDARDEDGQGVMSDQQIRDEALTFLFAGHETITNSMTWALILLAQNQEYYSRLVQESDAFFKSKNFEELNNAPWISACLDEVMRLNPPVWVLMREAQGADQLGDLTINPKTNVVLAAFLTHNSKDFWEKPERFYPERFLPENKKSIKPGSYFPYGLGPRGCIGNYFATFESKIILAHLIRSFNWSIENKEVQTSSAGITHRPTNNIRMNFQRKNLV